MFKPGPQISGGGGHGLLYTGECKKMDSDSALKAVLLPLHFTIEGRAVEQRLHRLRCPSVVLTKPTWRSLPILCQ